MKNNQKCISKNKRKLAFVITAIILLIIILIFFLKNNYKNFKIGNTMISKNIEDIEEYILNISSYDAEIEITVESNKNSNKYIVKQQYTSPNITKQVIIEPSNIEGLETIYDGSSLKINNSKLGASSIYENYPYLAENFLWLNTFIQEYKEQKENSGTVLREENDNVVMELKTQNKESKYICYKMLYIDKKTGKPTKLIIKDVNKNELVYILYNEITVNGLQKNEILAFKFTEELATLL